MSSHSQTKLYFIGKNDQCEFGLGHAQEVRELKECPNPSITKVFSAYAYNIFSDDNLNHLWAAGANDQGECGIGNPNMSAVMVPTFIPYFKQNTINIEKICVTVSGSCTFFISDQQKLYASGEGVKLIVAPEDASTHAFEPMFIPGLQNVIDVQSCDVYQGYCIAICLCDHAQILKIIANWSRRYQIPYDIINLLVIFAKATAIYATTNYAGTGHPKDAEIKNEDGFNRVKFFDDKNITKIAVGMRFTWFLESSGKLWGCGKNSFDQLAIETQGDDIDVPMMIEYFDDNGIRIKDIACGNSHSLAIDVEGKVYSWGQNDDGQCGLDNIYDVVDIPELIEEIKEYKVEVIKCGNAHSYVRTECNKHFMFGSNEYGECFGGDERIVRPHRVDEIILDKCKVKRIIDIEVGYYSTKVIVSMD